MRISIDGALVDEAHAQISVLDRGFLYGDGLFEVLRTWNGVAIDLDAHLERMAIAASELKLPFDAARVKAAVLGTLSSGDERIRIMITRGRGTVAARLAEIHGGHLIVITEPLAALPRTTTAAFVDWQVPQRARAYKSLAYIDNLIAKELAAERGAEEAFRLGPDGSVVEGATSNLFIVSAGQVQTPPLTTGILPGVTRVHVAACCKLVERRLTVHDVKSADEIFVTSAVRGIVAVTSLDGEVVTNGVGQVTQKLASAYAERMSRANIPA